MEKVLNSKQFVIIVFTATLIFLSYHIFIWNLYTSKMFNLPKGFLVGDLARMSYQTNSLNYRKSYVDLNSTHFYKKNYNGENIDIVTLGDSFFNGGGGGKNAYIQDYLAQYTHLNILNILNFNPEQSPLSLIENMLEVGWFKKYQPKYLIVETVERHLPSIFNLEKKFRIDNLATLEEKIISPGQDLFTYVPDVKMINTANYKIPYYTIAYNYNNHAQKQVYKLKLKNELFSVKNKQTLLCYHEDIENVNSFTDNKLDEINNKLNVLSQKLSAVGVKLIFVVAVDKYDLYFDSIDNNPFPVNTFFQRYNKLKKDYIFIDTKQSLTPLLENKVLDIFYADDTHWSYKANERVAKEISNILGKKE